MATPNVTGGELGALWKVAKMHLPTVENVYIGELKTIHPVSGDSNTEKYGNCHSQWVQVAYCLEKIMYTTATSLQDTANGVIEAINAYQYVDGDNAKGLTDAGKELKRDIEIKKDNVSGFGEVERDEYGPEPGEYDD